jgi:selenocysteine lyase/cysteine desulfurase
MYWVILIPEVQRKKLHLSCHRLPDRSNLKHLCRSITSSQIEIQARKEVLKYFDASEDEYMIVFTSNASGALKLIAEAYPFNQNTRLILSEDSHNSLHGMRNYASKAGARTDYIRVLDTGLIDHEHFTVRIQRRDINMLCNERSLTFFFFYLPV